MKNTTPKDFLTRGDIVGLLDYRRARHGDLTMTAPILDADGNVTIPTPVPVPEPAKLVTHEDLIAAVEKARKEEKDKLYALKDGEKSEVEKLREAQAEYDRRFTAFETDLTSRQKEAADSKKAAEAAVEEKRQAELSFAEKLAEAQVENDKRFAGLTGQLEQQSATLAKEREFTALADYRAGLLQDNTEILPDLRPYVQGNTKEEIDNSISSYEATSRSILSEIIDAQKQQLVGSQGVGITSPPAGPLDMQSGQQTFTAAEIGAMSVQEYAKYRPALLGAAGRSPQERGVLG